MIEPRSRTVDAALLMEWLFKLTELESRIPLNMNVLVKGRIPKVIGLAEALGNGSTIGARCCSGAPAIDWRRSTTGSKCLAATSSPISTSTR